MKIINYLISIISIGLGFLYIFDFYGIQNSDTDADIIFWGKLSIILGSIHFLSTTFSLILKEKNTRLKVLNIVLKIINMTFLLIIQLAPIILFLSFDNMMVVETPESPRSTSGVAHWYYSLPHVSIVILFVISIIFSRKKINKKGISDPV